MQLFHRCCITLRNDTLCAVRSAAAPPRRHHNVSMFTQY